MLLGHHAEGFVMIEVMGREFPDGPTEHVLGAAAGLLAVGLMLYGAYALVRDVRRWRRA